MTAATGLAPLVGVLAACVALGVARATYYRRRAPQYGPRVRRASPPRRLPDGERRAVLDVLNEPRFVDLAPAEVHATLLDEQRYLCSVRTMHRILAENGAIRDRRDQLVHARHARPELLATAPNQLWSWDITKLLGPAKWTYFYLYVILDVFSRYVVGWMLADGESKTLAAKLIETTCAREHIVPGQLTVHADRGAAMISKPVAFLLGDLGVTKTHSRPHVSDDNPFSEAHFKTLKYRPGSPSASARSSTAAHCRDFFRWYNHEHHHSGIAMLTPHEVHHGLAGERLAERAIVLRAAHAAHPERFPRGVPKRVAVPREVWINRPISCSSRLASEIAAH